MRSRRLTALVPTTRADLEIDCTREPPPVFSAEMLRGGTVTVTVAHDFAGDEEALRAGVAAKIEGGPIRVTIERAPAPPGPDEPRVTVTAGRWRG